MRTKSNGIKKVDIIFENKTVNRYGYETGSDWDGKWYSYIKTTDITKHSKNLIDLIEDTDIVEVEISEEWVIKEDSIRFIIVGQTYVAQEIKEALENGIYKIKTILTHEQYEKNCYRLEE